MNCLKKFVESEFYKEYIEILIPLYTIIQKIILQTYLIIYNTLFKFHNLVFWKNNIIKQIQTCDQKKKFLFWYQTNFFAYKLFFSIFITPIHICLSSNLF